jgi:hypothetical protein
MFWIRNRRATASLVLLLRIARYSRVSSETAEGPSAAHEVLVLTNNQTRRGARHSKYGALQCPGHHPRPFHIIRIGNSDLISAVFLGAVQCRIRGPDQGIRRGSMLAEGGNYDGQADRTQWLALIFTSICLADSHKVDARWEAMSADASGKITENSSPRTDRQYLRHGTGS